MLSSQVSDNKRIAKNTILLYLRLLFSMAVSLYTSRVILNTLGIIDYGIYNVVGGIVSMFIFLNSAMVTSTQRYLTFELGKGNMQRLKEVFSSSIYIHVAISLAVVLLTETIGMWFFYEKMVIPSERMTAAMWVFQLSILNMVISIMSAPYTSAIVAHEHMGAFAVISIAEVLLKLLIVYLLVIGNVDKLILFAILCASVQLLIRFLYTYYCHRYFTETRHVYKPDKLLIKEMGSFAGWNIWGNLAAMLYGTGLNMLLNVFFGPVVNAARGVAVQVETAVANFSANFLMAVNPQITKLYAQGNLKEMHTLLFRASKFTCFLLFALSLPILLETETILSLWLKVVPDYTVPFLRLLLFIVIIDSVSRPLMTSAAATGNVKVYQSVIGGILLTIVPIAYIVLRYGGSPVSVYVVHLSVAVVAFITRLLIIRPMIHLSISEYVRKVILKCTLVCCVSFVLSFTFKTVIPSGVLWSLLTCMFSFIMVLGTTYVLGLTRSERAFVRTKCVSIIHRVI